MRTLSAALLAVGLLLVIPASVSTQTDLGVASKNGVVVSSSDLAAETGAMILTKGGNAVDAAVATQFALTVVEPMMVGLIGGTTCHIRLPDGRHLVIDGMSAVPRAGRPDMFKPLPGAAPDRKSTRLNSSH